MAEKPCNLKGLAKGERPTLKYLSNAEVLGERLG